MATFSTANRSTATVTADVDAVWDVLTDPDQIARLTPFLHSVKEEGEHWVWQLTRVPVLASIPRIVTRGDVFKRGLRIGVAAAGLAVVLAAAAGASCYLAREYEPLVFIVSGGRL